MFEKFADTNLDSSKSQEGKYESIYQVQKRSEIAKNQGYEYVGAFSEGMAKMEKDEKSGFINENEKEVIPAKYNEAETFSEGLAKVKTKEGYGFINTQGEEVINPKYGFADSFAPEGVTRAIYFGDPEGCGLIDKEGNEVIPFGKYQDMKPVSEGFIAIQENDKWGFIDRYDQQIHGAEYDKISSFSEGVAFVKKEGEPGMFINKAGEKVIEADYDWADKFSDGLAMVSKNEKIGFIDKDGNEVISCNFDQVESFSEDLAAFKEDGYYGYINKGGKKAIPPKFKIAHSFNEGVALVKEGEDRYFIDHDGNKVME